jgi:hypothetical protein
MTTAPDASGDHSPGEETLKPPGQVPPAAAAESKKSVFSDNFDDPERRSADDELPEDEPLTPELVEEEAIRGDFMLRWAVICLAALMAFTCISDTKPLVLIRSGEQMRQSGFLPPRTDQLSLTMEGKNISNVGWLFDHTVSLFWSVGSEKGLTALKVLIAALSAWLLTRISIPGLPTWFSSICTALAVVACSQDYVPAHELISIAGMCLVMQRLVAHRLGTASGLEWKLPLLIAVWCNFDPRAWVGALVVGLYAVGNAVHRRGLLRAGVDTERTPSPLMMTAGLSFAALLANPFPTASLLSPLSLYTREYPAFQVHKDLKPQTVQAAYDNRVDFYSLINVDAIRLFDHTHVAGVLLLVLAVGVLCISMGSEQANASRGAIWSSFLRGLLRLLTFPGAILAGRPFREAGFLFALMGVFLLCLLAAHELPAAAIVASVAAGISAQEWYRRNFSMTYTVDSMELLFSRGGRAATVLAMAGVAFAVVTSRLPGAAPLGFGFDPETKVTVDTLSQQIQKLEPDARVFHTRLEHGDLMIWNGRKSFVDSRVLPFSSASSPILELHAKVRDSVLHPPAEPPTTSDPKVKEKFAADQQKSLADARRLLEEYRVSHVMVRLAPPGLPDYLSIKTLAAQGEFLPVSIEASAAVLQKFPPQTSPEEIASKIPNYIEIAFRKAEPSPPAMRILSGPRGFYDRWIYRTRPFMSAARRMAMHYLELAAREPQNPTEAMNSIALITLGIRQINLTLQETPEDVGAWLSLGFAYQQLGTLEELLGGNNASPKLRQTRYIQSVCAFRQALRLEPSDIRGWEALLGHYQRMQRQDLLLETLEKWLEQVDKLDVPEEARASFEEYRTQRFAQKRELEDMLLESDAQLDRRIDEQKQANAQAILTEQAKAGKKSDEAADLAEANAEEAREALLSAALANSAGRPRRALNGLQEKSALLRGIPPAMVLMGQLLLETGELEEAHQLLLGLNQEALKQPEQFVGIAWHLPVAISQLGMGDYSLAAETWANELTFLERQTAQPGLWTQALFSLPMVGDVNLQFGAPLPVWPFVHASSLGQQISTLNELKAETALLQAIAKLEDGDVPRAKALLMRVITEYGETRVRQLAAFYHAMSDADAAKTLEPWNVSLWEEFDYPGDVAPTPPAEAGSPGSPASSANPGGRGLPGSPSNGPTPGLLSNPGQ